MIILVRTECPYVQFRAARVTSTEFVVGGYKLVREGDSSQVSGVMRCICSMNPPSSGTPCFPLYRSRGSGGLQPKGGGKM